MLPLIAFAAFYQPSAMLVDLDKMAQARDVAGIHSYYGPQPAKLPRDPMAVLKTNGAYDTGKFGWHAIALKPPGEKKSYVVFSTPLTLEDIGERLFEIRDDRLIRYVNELEGGNWQIKRHNFHISFKLPTKQAFLTDEVTVVHSGGTASELFLRFSPNYRMASITDSDTGKAVPFAQAGGIVALGRGVGPVRHLTLHYSAYVNLPNYGGSISSRYAMLSDEYWYPTIARQPSPYDATVEVPKGWTVVAQGEVAAHKTTSVGETWTYRMDLPVTFMSLSAGKYHTYEQKIGGRAFRTWSFRMTPEQSRWQAELYAPILSLYDGFATYPFSGYGAVDQPNYGSGMLEAYSFNTGQQGSYPAEEPHEPSHTWWGGMINNTYLKSFWNESFAVFCEGYYFRNVPIGDPEERRRAYVQIPVVSPAFDAAPLADAPADIGPAASSLGYGKGGYVLQMLEAELGTDKMVEAMRRWLADQPRGSLGEWEGFENAVGPAYKWFFDEWVRRPGYANFSVDNVVYADGNVTGHLAFQGPAYKIHAEAMLVFPDGTRKTEVFDTTENRTSDGYTFHIPCPKKPTFISIDPWLRILRPIAPDERTLSVSDALAGMRPIRDPQHPEYLKFLEGPLMSPLVKSVDKCLLIGHPDTMPILRPLCDAAGFRVAGTLLTYKGTTVDLRSGGAMAVLSLPSGGRCAIGLGNVHLLKNLGNAQVVVFDGYGRFLRGSTSPKLSGNLTFRIQ